LENIFFVYQKGSFSPVDEGDSDLSKDIGGASALA
jgi:hypothetical protein